MNKKLKCLKDLVTRLTEPNNGMDACFGKQEFYALVWAIAELEKVGK
jgi:hypothetical protein